MLRLAPDLKLPDEAITQTFALLAMRGAGKTNTARVMAEQMFARKLPFIAVDPVGSWYGLRSSRDGKSAGLPLPIFGGQHGDVPLERQGGSLIADLVVDERLSCVLDLTSFDSEAAKKAFLLDFARRLYLRNKEPLHLFLEEADDYIPQKPMRDEAQLLRAWENIVRRGRARGLGITLITQRSASINKNVLTQVETLIAMRATSPQDRAVIEDWLKYHAQTKEIAGTLASLEKGEAWVWSPQWLHIMQRVRFELSTTFDSGATPDMKASRAPATLADVDLDAVAKKMAATIERAKADDPKELKKRITELEKAAKSKSVPTSDDYVALLEQMKELAAHNESLRLELVTAVSRAHQYRVGAEQALAGLQRFIDNAAPVTMPDAVQAPRPIVPQVKAPIARVQRAPLPRRDHTDLALGKSKQRILNALAFLQGVGVLQANKTQLALLSEQSPTSGGYFNNLGTLRSAGLITYPGANLVALTPEGERAAQTEGVPTSTEELHRALANRLPKSKWAIVAALISAYPNDVSKAALADAVGQSATSGGYFNNLGSLRSLGLIDYPEPGRVVALPVLFLEG